MIEQKINNLENTLSFYQIKPIYKALDLVGPFGMVVGPIASSITGIPIGISKALLGLTQVVAAIAIGVITCIPMFCQHAPSKSLFLRACKHIPHGIGNIMAGVLEGTPIIGGVVVGWRFLRVFNAKGIEARTTEYQMMEHPDFKFYPYDHNTIENSDYWSRQVAKCR